MSVPGAEVVDSSTSSPRDAWCHPRIYHAAGTPWNASVSHLLPSPSGYACSVANQHGFDHEGKTGRGRSKPPPLSQAHSKSRARWSTESLTDVIHLSHSLPKSQVDTRLGRRRPLLSVSPAVKSIALPSTPVTRHRIQHARAPLCAAQLTHELARNGPFGQEERSSRIEVDNDVIR
ncbi:hypothetical protein K437DRAFT_29022 [Tilletiaria anomala UBC 951]|uniref:Uncharacterized protein n=1 Tax=Tilletiaria anomala (strain ATCC 24038 / CBS 436.72 / UBC 951) TaxID=1037660 RepID=A0A066V9Q9_TILAU|nr:uncharacterized protein K437DRAFT_29022 [Tilletiaria anomala UBC 951]KDN38211.1 hypothetical protein K437DRAFT_29022 [Tilletiaria anomala UBC 951]